MSYLQNFNFQIYGNSTSHYFVFLHGLMGYAQNWRKIISAFEESSTILAYDQRGHGKSFQPEQGYAPSDYADDLLKIIDELGWKKIILVGHSMGARNALNFSARFPERVEKFVLVDIGPDTQPDGWRYFQDLLDVVPSPFPSRERAREFFKGEFQAKAKTKENVDTIAQYFYANIIDLPNGQADWRFSKNAIIQSAKQARAVDQWTEIKSLRVPTLLVRGELSKDLSEKTFQEMLDANSVIRGVKIEGAGHWVHADQPLKFIEALKDFTS